MSSRRRFGHSIQMQQVVLGPEKSKSREVGEHRGARYPVPNCRSGPILVFLFPKDGPCVVKGLGIHRLVMGNVKSSYLTSLELLPSGGLEGPAGLAIPHPRRPRVAW